LRFKLFGSASARKRRRWTNSGKRRRFAGSPTSCVLIWSPCLDQECHNLAASVRQRLANLARQRNEDFGLLLTKYALERLLFRISQSEYQKIFVLKGALLFELWTEQAHRPTRDADFLSNGDNDPSRFETIFKEICALTVDEDGLQFDPASVKAQRIKEDADYEGVRVTFLSYLERARIPMQIDIGFGDTITPPPVEISFPTILNGPAPLLLTYPKETVVAEKFEAMVKLGMANSRMKDLYDLRLLSQLFPFGGEVLAEAIVRTFERRKTAIPTNAAPPRAITAEFYEMNRSSASGELSIPRIVCTLRLCH